MPRLKFFAFFHPVFSRPTIFRNMVAADQPAMKTIFNVDDENLLVTENWLKNYTANTDTALDYFSKVVLRQSFDDMINMYRLVGGVLCAILALIGILNFINSMTTSILSRHKEIAMLQSVGMTGRQVKQMLMYEGMGYSVLGLLCSLILSIVGSITVVRMMGAELTIAAGLCQKCVYPERGTVPLSSRSLTYQDR